MSGVSFELVLTAPVTEVLSVLMRQAILEVVEIRKRSSGPATVSQSLRDRRRRRATPVSFRMKLRGCSDRQAQASLCNNQKQQSVQSWFSIVLSRGICVPPLAGSPAESKSVKGFPPKRKKPNMFSLDLEHAEESRMRVRRVPLLECALCVTFAISAFGCFLALRPSSVVEAADQWNLRATCAESALQRRGMQGRFPCRTFWASWLKRSNSEIRWRRQTWKRLSTFPW